MSVDPQEILRLNEASATGGTYSSRMEANQRVRDAAPALARELIECRRLLVGSQIILESLHISARWELAP